MSDDFNEAVRERRLEQQHAAVWAVIDDIAARCELSASRLAIVSGHDSTSFNKSKRRLKTGEPRWPSVEVIARVLLVAHMTFSEFGALVDQKMGR